MSVAPALYFVIVDESQKRIESQRCWPWSNGTVHFDEWWISKENWKMFALQHTRYFLKLDESQKRIERNKKCLRTPYKKNGWISKENWKFTFVTVCTHAHAVDESQKRIESFISTDLISCPSSDESQKRIESRFPTQKVARSLPMNLKRELKVRKRKDC